MPAKRDPLLTAKGTRYTYAGWVRAYNAALKSGIPNLAYRLGDSYPDFYNKHQEQARKSDLGSRQRQQVSEADKRILDDARKNGETLAEYVKRREGRTEYIARFNGKNSHQYVVAAQIERDAKDLLRRTPSKPRQSKPRQSKPRQSKPRQSKPSANRPVFGSPPPKPAKKPATSRPKKFTKLQRQLIAKGIRIERQLQGQHNQARERTLRSEQREIELRLLRLDRDAERELTRRITEMRAQDYNRSMRDIKKKHAFTSGRFSSGTDYLK